MTYIHVPFSSVLFLILRTLYTVVSKAECDIHTRLHDGRYNIQLTSQSPVRLLKCEEPDRCDRRVCHQ